MTVVRVFSIQSSWITLELFRCYMLSSCCYSLNDFKPLGSTKCVCVVGGEGTLSSDLTTVYAREANSSGSIPWSQKKKSSLLAQEQFHFCGFQAWEGLHLLTRVALIEADSRLLFLLHGLFLPYMAETIIDLRWGVLLRFSTGSSQRNCAIVAIRASPKGW